jgi:magnesium transporter
MTDTGDGYRGRRGEGPSSAPQADLVSAGFEDALVDWAYYRDGRRDRDHTSYAEALARARRDEGFVWIGLLEPTERQVALLGEEFGLHPLALEDAVKAHQRPKLERYADDAGEILFAVFKTVRYVPHSTLTAASEVVETGDVMVFCGTGFVITVRHGQHGELTGLRRSLEHTAERLGQGPAAVLHAVADHIVDRYLEVAHRVQGDIDLIASDMFSPRGWRNIDRVYQLKREVLELRQAVMPLAGPIRELAEGRYRLVPDHVGPYFRDVDDHLLRVREQIMEFDELLTSIVQAGLAQAQVAENDDMRRIAAWVAILAALTMIVGIYGMNFDNMPELKTRYGYFVVLGVMAAVSYTLYRLFKRNRWL